MSNLAVNMHVSGDTSQARGAVKELRTETKALGSTSERATSEASRGYKQLKASIDPVYRAEQNLKRTQDTLNRAVRAGVITQAQAKREMQQWTAAMNNGSVAVERISRRLSSGVSMQRRMGLAVQNSSYQFADLAVQIDGGVDPMRAVGQQLPQLLGGFGVLGVVMGAAVAIAIPLGRALFGAADAAEETTDPLDELTTSVNAYRAAAGDAASDTKDLISTYGSASEAVRELLDLQEELSLRQAKSDLNAAVGSLLETGSIGEDIVEIKALIAGIDFGDTISPAGKKNLADLETSYRDLGESLGITTDDAKDLIDALEATSTAGTAEEQLTWLSAIREGYLGLVGDVADLTDEQAAFLQELKTLSWKRKSLWQQLAGSHRA
ncbi:MAG: hypothetical protein GQ535_14860 [Rhodobacteraceae bacterium]|nr:hypothetical protein [Paracoccaceae bacterium]